MTAGRSDGRTITACGYLLTGRTPRPQAEQLLAYLAEQLADQDDTDKATTATATAAAVIDNTTED